MNRKKRTILTVSFLTALVLALGLSVWACRTRLADYRLAARYSAGQAFQETVRSVEAMSRALAKSVYATDGCMCSRVCSEAYANALAAETALASLPFSTQELEQLSGFLNVAGDYAYTLAYESAREGFTQEQLKTLTDMARTASGFSDTLAQLQSGLDEGELLMDSREVRLENAGSGREETQLLSARLLAYEESFQPMAELHYDGKYGAAAEEPQWKYTRDEMQALAAEYAGVRPEELELRYEYKGDSGRVCYAAGDTLICVGPAGVESLSQSRLVGEDRLSAEKALEIAEDYLAQRGFRDLQLKDSQINGAVAVLHFARVTDGAVCLDNTLSVSVALDDGSIYGFSAARYRETGPEVRWEIDQAQAERTLPKSLKLTEARKVVIRSEGENDLACYELSCADGDRRVLVYVDAATGLQRRIQLVEEANV